MSRRQGSIRPRGNALEIRWQVAGKTRTETFHGPRKAAEKRLRELLSMAEGGHAPSRDTLAAWLDEWLLAIRAEVSPLTIHSYKKATENIFKPMLGDIRLASLDRIAIRKCWADLGDRLAPSSIRMMHRILSASLSYAVEVGELSSNPCAGWRKGRGLPKLANTEKPALSAVNLAAVIDAARGHPMFAPVTIAAGTGARRSEIAALLWSDIDLATGIVTLARALKQVSTDRIEVGLPKGGKSRRVRLPPSYLGLLNEWRLQQAERMLALGHRVGPDDPICTDAIGEVMTPNRITNQFTDLARRCGIKATFHDLRHAHASLLLAGGTDIKTVQLRLGHATPSITLNTYSHAIPGTGDDEAERLDRALSGNGSSVTVR
jgi:integrase